MGKEGGTSQFRRTRSLGWIARAEKFRVWHIKPAEKIQMTFI